MPVLSPRLSSLWLGLITPVFARTGRRLIESIRHSTVVRDPTAAATFGVAPTPVRQAIARAIAGDGPDTRWSDALSSARRAHPWGGVRVGNTLVDSRTVGVSARPEQAFRPIRRIGGDTGWYYGQWLWRLRGWLDLLSGGVGLRRGRRDPDHLRPGDVVDCWRVSAIEEPRWLRLEAEMRLPGRARLEFRVVPAEGGARITQTASFAPHGLPGILYWYSVWPLHQLVFAGMLRRIARAGGVMGNDHLLGR